MIMPYMIAMTVHGHGSQMMTACFLPWIMFLLFKLVNKLSLVNFSFLALFVGLQLQRGHIQIAYYTWMMIGLFIVLNNYKIIKLNSSTSPRTCYLLVSDALKCGFDNYHNIKYNID